MASRIEILKSYFGTEAKPVTSTELIAFAKADKKGFNELADEVAKVTGQVVEVK